MRKISFNKNHKSELRRLGVTKAQITWLERALPLVRIDIEGYASNRSVRDAVAKVHAALAAAEKDVSSMHKGVSKAKTEAAGHLASGASSIDPLVATAGIETATDGTVPERVDVPTLLRLLVLAAERGLADMQTRQYRKAVPTKSIERIVAALNRPVDTDSRSAASTLLPGRYRRSFVDLCVMVFQAASGHENVSVDRAIRDFLATYRQDCDDSRRWYFVGQQAP